MTVNEIGYGITSTYVENTLIIINKSQLVKDHLHIRGEYELLSTPDEDPIGSPPHTWRILALNMYDRVNVEDHLHIRGEYHELGYSYSTYQGSPPHTWRILRFSIYSHRLNRITSTYVENTLLLQIRIIRNQDHLHIRGEYLLPGYHNVKPKGSPPHTWRIQ